MRIEKLTKKSKEVCVNVTNGVADSLRIKNVSTATVRAYDNGFIGIAGKMGDANFEALEKEAKDNLSRGIPYPDKPEKPLDKSINARKHIVNDKDFLPFVSEAAKRIADENPSFIINGKAYLNDLETEYSDGNRHLKYAGNSCDFAVIFKDKKSANIMDGSVAVSGDSLIGEDFFKDVKLKLDCFLSVLPHVKGDKVKVIAGVEVMTYILQHFVADVYCNNASLLNGKLGTKVFSEKLSAMCDRTPEKALLTPFYDTEGVVNEDYKAYLIKNGVMKGLATTKYSADKYGVENSGTAAAEYAGAPSISAIGFDIERTAGSLEELIGGGEAIYLDLTSGGDMTPDGNISLPVQVAFLYKGGKIVGRLPEFSLCGNMFDIFGKDYIGATSLGSIFKSLHRDTVIVTEMNVVNKK